MKNEFQNLLEQRESSWQSDIQMAKERVDQMAEYFRVKEEQFMEWFQVLSQQIETLNFNETTATSRKIEHLMKAMTDVEKFKQIESSLQMRQFLGETKEVLKHMLRTLHLDEPIVIKIAHISDASYSWANSFDLIEQMKQMLWNDPNTLILLRAHFMKMSSILNIPLIRIIECDSPDMLSVSKFYSDQLVEYVKKIIQIIPQKVFAHLEKISQLHQQLNAIKLEDKIEREVFKQMALVDKRNELINVTYQISTLTEGFFALENTLVGIIEIDPAALLENGIRNSLLKQIDTLFINYSTRINDLEKQISGIKKAFLYTQDFLNVKATKIWDEQLQKVCLGSLQKDVNKMVGKLPPKNNIECKIFSQLTSMIDQMTSKAIYKHNGLGWFDTSNNEVFGLVFIRKLIKIFDFQGLYCLDVFICHYIKTILKESFREFEKLDIQGIKNMAKQLYPLNSIIDRTSIFQSLMQAAKPASDRLLANILKVGQMQLIRKLICSQLQFQSKSQHIHQFMANVNQEEVYEASVQLVKEGTYDQNLIFQTNQLMHLMGFVEPRSKIYIQLDGSDSLGLFMFLFCVPQLSKLVYTDGNLEPEKKQKGPIQDGATLAAGVFTYLTQVHSNHTDLFLGHIGQYVSCGLNNILYKVKKENKIIDLPNDVKNLLYFLHISINVMNIPREKIVQFIPELILNTFDFF